MSTSAVSGVQLKKEPVFGWRLGKKTKPAMMARALRALAMILRVGEPEARALEIAGSQFKKYTVGRAFLDAAEKMRQQGATFSQAMLAQSTFPRTVHELVSSSPTASNLHQSLTTAARLVAQGTAIKKKLGTAMIQPAFMLGMAIVFMFVSAAFIIPGIISSFSTLGSETPAMAMAVVKVADVAKYVIGAVLVVIALAVAFWVSWGRTNRVCRAFVDSVSIRMPIIGSIVQLAATSRLLDLLAANLRSGRTETEALESAGAGCGNDAIYAHCQQHADVMRQGHERFAGFANSRLFPDNTRYLMASSPSVAQQLIVMDELAVEYRKESEQQLEAFSKTVEPLVTYIVYAIAGLLIVAVVLPMYSVFPAIMDLSDGGSTAPGVSDVPMP